MTADEAQAAWREAHRRFALAMRADGAVREDEALPAESRPANERLVQVIWYDRLFRAEGLTTASGKRLTIIDPGTWNTGRGPDFLDARFELAGELRRGDIEVHVDTAGWVRHRHHQDYVYNSVALHVALRSSDDRPYDECQNGERLERVVLEHALEQDIETLARTINLDDYPYGRPAHLGVCHETFARLGADELRTLLLAAGRARVEDKIARFQAQLATADFPQVIYQALMVGQGYKSNKTLYFLLSKRTPLSQLVALARDNPQVPRADFFLAVFLYLARFLPAAEPIVEAFDEETRELASQLESAWKLVRPYYADCLLPPTKRWMAGMRPAGFPPRRFAAVAVLLDRLLDARAPLLTRLAVEVQAAPGDAAKPAEWRKYWTRLAELLVVDEPEHYFARHFTLGGKVQKPQALLGDPAARTVLFNVMLPALVLRARRDGKQDLEDAVWRLILRFPALEESSVSRFMQRRLFGDQVPPGLFENECFQQALLKVFGDCCSGNERTCADCTFMNSRVTG